MRLRFCFNPAANSVDCVPQPNPVKTIETFDIEALDGGEIVFTVTGNAFLYKVWWW